MIQFDETVCGDLTQSSRLEWLETNGLGGFASSTVPGLNTRRYHGLLTAATKPPVGRMVLLSKMEDRLIVSGEAHDLSANQYPGVIHPQGYACLKQFRLDPFPTSVYAADSVEIEKRIFMVDGQNTTVIEYEALHGSAVLELRPLIAFRDYHALTHCNDLLDQSVMQEGGLVSVAPYPDLPRLYFAHNASSVEVGSGWYYNFEYAAEQERGLDAHEDLFNPFTLRFELKPRDCAVVIASLAPHAASQSAELRTHEVERRHRIRGTAPSAHTLIQDLTAAAHQFIVRRGDGNSVIAGYHWFADWGRDTMIALPGVTLATGQWGTAKNILTAFAASIDQGMLPNRFPDAGDTPEYNTVDATLWFFEAVRSYLHYSGDIEFVRDHMFPKLKDILDWHLRCTRFGIYSDDDGLLRCGEPGVQLTWMDAKIGDWVVTPRTGKPVEIQALWYNALKILEEMSDNFGDAACKRLARQTAERARASFENAFWNEADGCLFDVVDGDTRDASIRPNQIFALSLTHRLLPAEKENLVLTTVERELLTPFGLRSLSPRDPRYRPRYEGGVWERDSAYHQGTVWPWLMGPFLSAYVRVHNRSAEAKARAGVWLAGFEDQMRTYGLGHIAEIADGDVPHTPRGCVAQAWSAAELLRAAVEDVYEIAPRRGILDTKAAKAKAPRAATARIGA